MLDWLADTILRRSLRLRYEEIRSRQPLGFLGSPYGITTQCRHLTINDGRSVSRWQGCMCTVEADGIHLYPHNRKWDTHLHLKPTELRWFGRPQKYHSGNNDIWLHFEQDGRWHLLMLRTSHFAMQGFVRALKGIATPEQITAYRRQRPYIHAGPCPAWRAEEDLYGVWTVKPEPLALYLMPSMLVELQKDQVIRTLPLETIQNIEVMRRLDDPSAHGVLRFRQMLADGSEQIAYTMPAFVLFAEALITATRRWLEQPPIIYGKKGEEEE
jgi:hypothetical protein